jgi:hypothetical protein
MNKLRSVIHVSDDGHGEYYVDVLENDEDGDNAECTADSSFRGRDARLEAERRAEVLAKLLGCDWECNY